MNTTSNNTQNSHSDPAATLMIKRDVGGFFSSINPVALFLLLTFVYTGIEILGVYMGDIRRRAGIVEPEVAMETAVASVLGLLAFILGFMFSLTWTRFANRNILVLTHAKTIGVCYLRAMLIPAKQKLECRKILFEYATLLQSIHARPDFDKSLSRLNELHMALWDQTTSLVHEDMDSELRSLFTSASNDLISIALERKIIALFIRIPNAIWASVLILAFVGLFAFGYQAGIGGVGKFFQLLLLPVALALVKVLIADLNSVDVQRNFKVTRQPLNEIVEMMAKMPA